ncbi:UPF0489 protein C5orf22-like [Coccinella septempunctata]|uniref:UPF0489 protein C5orf22-like n=1 Tax=Coccinella septempunctata TaxID=41139 RepID=UPI001D084CC4|nr:UPF0489 protein C5orf22-like [Coccinella septempunctata]
MDRTMYGKMQPSDWAHPYQCTIKNGTLPGCDRHQSQKSPKQIPIYIAEDHHRVVEFIHQMIKKKCLPISDNTFVHLDSHPDMLIPKDMPADFAYDAPKLYEAHDIENWIIPNCYNGIIRHVVWVRPPWANQIRNKNQTIYVGKCKETKTIRLECRENYYIAEGLYRPKGQLEEVKDVTLDCVTLGNQITSQTDDIKAIRALSKTIDKNPVVLDIDLDFFSTQNPFLNFYDKAGLYQRLQQLFSFTGPESYTDSQILEAQENRLSQMSKIEKLFLHLEKFKKLPDSEEANLSPLQAQVESLVEALSEHYPIEDIQWDLIYSAGCTIDDHELPHHVSTDEEIDVLLQSFSNFLDNLMEPPKIITISRSSSDDYTPLEQVDEIQDKVLRLLSSKFDCASPILAYMEEKSGDEEQEDSSTEE